jgi:SAM-dependent methyltransferase
MLRAHDAAERVLVDAAEGPSAPFSPIVHVELTYRLEQTVTRAAQSAPIHLDRAVANTRTPGFGSAFVGMDAYLTSIARWLYNSEHPATKDRPEMQAQRRDADLFNDVVQALLRERVGWTVGGSGLADATLAGRTVNLDELSKGQQILLTWAIILHQQGAHLRDAVVVVDEPENHLHPDVCIQALRRLQESVLGDRGQIWLATHSVSLIAWAGLPSIHAVRDGRLSYAGNQVDRVVDGLVGGPKGREDLRAFLADAEELGLFQFAAECLLRPNVAEAREGDPQEACAVDIVAKHRFGGGGTALRVLDFGAGRGRFAAALAEAQRDPALTLDFLAYEPSKRYADELASRIVALRAAGASAARVDDLRTLEGDEASRVDVVVACNVLHELAVDEWLATFETIKSVLRTKGRLILIEDQSPSVGELPHSRGFLILDLLETRRVFGDSVEVQSIDASVPAAWRDRVTAIEIPCAALALATGQTIGRALHAVQKRAELQLSQLRAVDPETGSTFRRGRLHALYAMLWVNAKLGSNVYKFPDE